MAYIKLEEAIEKIDNLKCECDAHFYGEALTDAKSELLAMYTADVEEVKHGKWIHTDKANRWTSKDECSECTYHTWDREDLSHYNYCPHCGAKMDGGKI